MNKDIFVYVLHTTQPGDRWAMNNGCGCTSHVVGVYSNKPEANKAQKWHNTRPMNNKKYTLTKWRLSDKFTW